MHRRCQSRRILVSAGVAVATAVTVAGCGSGSGSAAPATTATTSPPAAVATGREPPPVTHLDWAPCRGGAGPSGYQCATLRVPLDYADPAKGTIGIALDRHVASGRPIGSIVENPGGPGGSGVDYLPAFVAQLPTSVSDRFDLVGFDPRGVDRSDPVVCGTGPELDAALTADPAPPTPAGFDAMVAADRRLADGCEADSARIVPYVSTADAARDLDRMRIALGEAKLTYFGYSYGTFLGATYAELFPTHVRAMVLDGAIDPALGAVAMVDQQSASLERNGFDAFLASCASGQCGWQPAGQLATDFDRLLAEVRAHPLAVRGSTIPVGPAVLLYGAAAGLYWPQYWPQLGRALSALDRGDGAPILGLFESYVGRGPGGRYSNEVEAENAVDCLDQPTPGLAGLRADAAAAERSAPTFGLLDLYGDATCSVWPVPATGRPAPAHDPGAPPVLVVGTTHDPITPYAWARQLARQLSGGVLLTRDGYGHTAYPFSSCIRSAVDRYLLTLDPPPAGTTCPTD